MLKRFSITLSLLMFAITAAIAQPVPPAPQACACAKKPVYDDKTYATFTGQIAVATQTEDLLAGDVTQWKNQVVMIWDLKNQATAPTDVWWHETTNPMTQPYSHSSWNVTNLGEVFGLTLDGSGNIYVASSQVYGHHALGSLSTGTGNQRAGQIYILKQNTNGAAAPFTLLPQGPAGEGLGNLYFDCAHDSLYASDFYDGLIYRINSSGAMQPNPWDHGLNLPTAVDLNGNNLGRTAILGFDGSSSYAALGRRPWAVRVYQNRLYYSIWSQDFARNSATSLQSQHGTKPTEIWSVRLAANGDPVGPARLEITLPPFNATLPYTNPVPDIDFGPNGTMLVAERSMTGNNSVYAHSSRMLEYSWNGSAWVLPNPSAYQVGIALYSSPPTNAAGGVAYDFGAGGRVWATGDALHFNNGDYVYGLEGFPAGGGTNANSLLIDLNDYVGFYNKMEIGDVRIPCPTAATNAFIEICKTSSLTNPVTGNFTFTATSGSFSTGPITIPAGVCTGPIGVPAGTVTVTEAATAGVGASAITAYGFNPSTSVVENRLVSSDLTNRIATVTAPAGGISAETIVEFTNFKIPTGVLEVCKEAAPGTTVSGNFSFNVAGAANNPYTVPVGACSGPILVQAGSVTITETPKPGFSLVDVSTLPVDRLVSLNLPAGSAVVNVAAGDVSAETVVRFVNTPATNTGQLKICKVAGPGVPVGQNFTINAGGVNYTVPAGPASLGGYCVVDGTFPIGTAVTVQENPPAPYQVLNITVNPPNRAIGVPVLANGNGGAMVTIGSGFTEVTVTNIGSTPTGQLKICKVAGANVTVGTNFSFTVANRSSLQTYTVPAGPSQGGGYCIADGTFQLGTMITVSEIPTAGYTLSGISVNGVPLPAGTPSANVIVGNGITEVAFTNQKGTPPDNPTAVAFLNVVNYEITSHAPIGGGREAWTYRADLLNAGPLLDSVTASLSSLDPSRVEVKAGQETLSFTSVPANSQITSSNTVTIVTANGAPVDFSKLKWTLETRRPPRRRAAR